MLYNEIAPNLKLALWDVYHADALFAVVDENRDHLRQWLPWVDSTLSAEDSRAFIIRSLNMFGKRREMHCAIWHDGNLVGAIGFNKIDWQNLDCEIGYWLAQSAEGNGIITAACRAIIDHAITNWRMNRIVIEAATMNRRSRAVPLRLGFKHEGTLRQGAMLGGEYIDLELYSLLASEWRTNL
jgi:ribosomal-protein-serine acetyltransferase